MSSANVNIDKLSQAFAAAIRKVDVARDAWVSNASDGYDLWLLVEPIELATERGLYALVDRMYERLPWSRLSLHILNPETFVNLDPDHSVPDHARHVGLGASE